MGRESSLVRFVIDFVKEDKGEIEREVGKCLRRQREYIFARSSFAGAGSKVAQGAGATFADHLARGFSYRVKQTAHAARFIANGTEREREKGLFEVSVAIEEHPLIFKVGSLAGQGTLERSAYDGPGRSPALAEILAHRLRMLAAADGPVAVVIDF